MAAADATVPVMVVAPDTFKCSLTAAEAGAALAGGLRRRIADARVVEHPMADGGEGSLEMVLARGFRPVRCRVHAPTGEPLPATYAFRVIAGEGSLDEQSLRRKGPIGVSVAAVGVRAWDRAVVVAGRSSFVPEQVRPLGIDAVHTLAELQPDAELSMRHAADVLETTAEHIAAAWLRGRPERTP